MPDKLRMPLPRLVRKHGLDHDSELLREGVRRVAHEQLELAVTERLGAERHFEPRPGIDVHTPPDSCLVSGRVRCQQTPRVLGRQSTLS
jgi:hypothetical protein